MTEDMSTETIMDKGSGTISNVLKQKTVKGDFFLKGQFIFY